MRRLYVVSAIVAGAVLLAFADFTGFFAPEAEEVIGQRLESTPLVDLDGQSRAVSELKGPGVVYFWATWCAPCLKTLSEIASGKEALPKGNFYTIAIESDVQLVRDTLHKTGFSGITFVATDGNGLLRQRYAGNTQRVLPYAVKLDGDSRIQRTGNGL